VRGWRLVLGGWLGWSEPPDRRRIHGYCRSLSKIYGQAHAFTAQDRMDWYSWVLSKDGVIFREFCWAGGINVDKGEIFPGEIKARAAADPALGWDPTGSDVIKIAADWSVTPERFGPKMRCSGKGCLAVTPWGWQHGIPKRPISVK
jgi:hypothetical protein